MRMIPHSGVSFRVFGQGPKPWHVIEVSTLNIRSSRRGRGVLLCRKQFVPCQKGVLNTNPSSVRFPEDCHGREANGAETKVPAPAASHSASRPVAWSVLVDADLRPAALPKHHTVVALSLDAVGVRHSRRPVRRANPLRWTETEQMTRGLAGMPDSYVDFAAAVPSTIPALDSCRQAC
jgi:hypothetical protein